MALRNSNLIVHAIKPLDFCCRVYRHCDGNNNWRWWIIRELV